MPTALLTQASKKPSKQTGAPVEGNGMRINTAPAALGRPRPGEATGTPVSVGPVRSATAGTATTQSLGTADVSEMMRMLKELSAQVEEVRAALVKHDQGPGE